KAKKINCVSNLKQWGLGQYLTAGDNNDVLPCDGMGDKKTYMSGSTPPSGTPNDPYAWFNTVPPNMGERSLSNYFAEPGGNMANKMPFPGRKGKIWHCPSAMMSDADMAQLNGGGQGGFFSYAMNIDLKQDGQYPNWMPKLSTLSKPVSTVLMFDCVFNPVTEKVNNAPGYNSVNPANRWKSIGTRHEKGTVINFADGHAKYFKIFSVTNNPSSATEPQNPEIIWDWTSR
ncbi:MAG TPA: hypothetical protein VNT26_09035, partial [Candidatus Sulfotelmatobacter sp.]|nr:hypothetical protein [Candidatus Sulfotelmatobacter sp.]